MSKNGSVTTNRYGGKEMSSIENKNLIYFVTEDVCNFV